VRRFSLQEYQQLIANGILPEGDAVELLEGWITPMSPHNPRHDGTLTLIQKALEPLLPSKWFVRVQSAIHTKDSAPEPDLAVVRGPYRRYMTRHPKPADIALLIEVADSSREIDLGMKSRIYASAGIPEYWVIDLCNSRVEVFQDPRAAGSAATYRTHETYGRDDQILIRIDDVNCGKLSVVDLLP
jgi:Uma2 family endonuclease